MKDFINWIQRALSEKNEPSSKRLCGFIGFIIAGVLIAYLALSNGATDTVKSLIDSLLLAATALLGISILNKFTK